MKPRNNSNRHKHRDVQETRGGPNELKTLLQKEVDTKPWKIPNQTKLANWIYAWQVYNLLWIVEQRVNMWNLHCFFVYLTRT